MDRRRSERKNGQENQQRIKTNLRRPHFVRHVSYSRGNTVSISVSRPLHAENKVREKMKRNFILHIWSLYR